MDVETASEVIPVTNEAITGDDYHTGVKMAKARGGKFNEVDQVEVKEGDDEGMMMSTEYREKARTDVKRGDANISQENSASGRALTAMKKRRRPNGPCQRSDSEANQGSVMASNRRPPKPSKPSRVRPANR